MARSPRISVADSRRRKTTARKTTPQRKPAAAARRERTPRRARHTRVVELGLAARGQLTRRTIVAGIALVLAGLFHVYTGLRVSELGYELSHAHEVQSRLGREKQELRVALAAATAPGRLEALAKERLGMGPPAPGQVVMLP
jgi:cell division protein FtsL